MTGNTLVGQRYKLLNVLGLGGMGKVYRALDKETGQTVAIKLIELPAGKGENLRKRFLSEVSSLSRLDHPSIVKMNDFGIDGTLAYIAMDLVDGRPLARAENHSALTKLAIQVSQALSAIHTCNIIHRDIKPENILVVEKPEPRAVLVDFGVAKQTDSNLKLTSTGSMVGTINYMSPEQVMGIQIDARSDLYSLGCVMYEALTGSLPFDSVDITTQISKILSQRPKRPRLLDQSIPPELEAIVMKMLEKSPESRHKNALELTDALERVYAGLDRSDDQKAIIQSRQNPFIGRTAQLRLFEKRLVQAMSGHGSIINLSGPQGIGKSRLLLEWQSIALSHGAKFILIESSTRNPMTSLIDQVTGYVRPEKESDPWLVENASLLGNISAKTAERFSLPAQSEETEQTRLVIAARNYLDAVFEDKTLIIALDQAKDTSLLATLKKLSKNIDSKKLIIVDTNAMASESVFMATTKVDDFVSIGPFTLEEVSELAKQMHGKPLGYESVEKIFNASAGNPFYVCELLTDLGKGSTTIEMVPGTIRQLFRDKMKNITPQSKLLLEKMAILMRPMPLADLQPIVRMDDDSLAASVSELLSKGLVTERYNAGLMDFGLSSPQISQILLEDTTGSDMVRACSELATSLEIICSGRTSAYDIEIGSFFLMSGDIDKGAKYILSGLKLLSESNSEVAIGKELAKLESIIQRLSDPKAKARIVIMSLASKTQQSDMTGINKFSSMLLSMIKENQIPNDLLLEAWLGLAFTYLETNQVEEATRAIENAKKTVPQSLLENDLKYWKTLAQLYIDQDKPEMAEKPANMVVMLSYRTGSRKAVANALSYQAVVSCMNHKHDHAIELLDQVKQIGSDTNDLRIELRALNNLAGVYFESGRLDEAEKTLIQAIAVSEKLEMSSSVIENLHRIIPILEYKDDFNGIRSILARMKKALDENPNSQYLSNYIVNSIKMCITDADFETALCLCDELVQLAMKTNRPLLIRSAMFQKSSIYYYMGKKEKALLECMKLDDLFSAAQSEDVLIDNYLNCFLASRICSKTGDIKKAENFFEKGKHLLSLYPETPQCHTFEMALTRFCIDWGKICQSRKPALRLLGNRRTPDSQPTRDLAGRIKYALENTSDLSRFQYRAVLEMLVLLMDIVMGQFNTDNGFSKEETTSLAGFACNFAETCIEFFSRTGTKLYKDEILYKNNELSRLKRQAAGLTENPS